MLRLSPPGVRASGKKRANHRGVILEWKLLLKTEAAERTDAFSRLKDTKQTVICERRQTADPRSKERMTKTHRAEAAADSEANRRGWTKSEAGTKTKDWTFLTNTRPPEAPKVRPSSNSEKQLTSRFQRHTPPTCHTNPFGAASNTQPRRCFNTWFQHNPILTVERQQWWWRRKLNW